LWLERVVPPAPAAWPLPPEPPVASSGPHLGYAIQWFSFTLVTLIGYVALLRRASREG
jgi:surfeit locus 1 family protein